jgi:hypothetical protein
MAVGRDGKFGPRFLAGVKNILDEKWTVYSVKTLRFRK